MSTVISEEHAGREMHRIMRPDGVTISYERFGSGPPLVLVHGSFSDHRTNWQEAKSLLKDRFTVYVLYEHPAAFTVTRAAVARLEELAEVRDWDRLVETFMLSSLKVPVRDVEAIRPTPFWKTWTDDAEATLGDLRAMVRHDFDLGPFRYLDVSVMQLVGTESPRDNYLTDRLDAILPNSTVISLQEQAHEGMTTAPEQFVEAISRFLLEP